VNAGLPSADIAALVLDPQTRTTLYAGTPTFGVFTSTDGARAGGRSNTGLPDVLLLLHLRPRHRPHGPDHALRRDVGGRLQEYGRGGNWTAPNTGLDVWRCPVRRLGPRHRPTAPATLYAECGDACRQVFVQQRLTRARTGAGVLESAANTGLTCGSGTCGVSRLDPQPPDPRPTLYAGTSGGGVLKSDGRGWELERGEHGTPGAGISRSSSSDPLTPTTLYAGMESFGVFKSTDGGRELEPGEHGAADGLAFSITALALAPQTRPPCTPRTDGSGAFKSTDAGTSWSLGNLGLPTNTVGAKPRSRPADPDHALRGDGALRHPSRARKRRRELERGEHVG